MTAKRALLAACLWALVIVLYHLGHGVTAVVATVLAVIAVLDLMM
jgi:hypothetical protein